MPEEIKPESDVSESEETFSQGGSLESRRSMDQWLKEKQEVLAANGYKPFPQVENQWKVNRADVEEALRRVLESPIQLDPLEPDEYW